MDDNVELMVDQRAAPRRGGLLKCFFILLALSLILAATELMITGRYHEPGYDYPTAYSIGRLVGTALLPLLISLSVFAFVRWMRRTGAWSAGLATALAVQLGMFYVLYLAAMLHTQS